MGRNSSERLTRGRSEDGDSSSCFAVLFPELGDQWSGEVVEVLGAVGSDAVAMSLRAGPPIDAGGGLGEFPAAEGFGAVGFAG